LSAHGDTLVTNAFETTVSAGSIVKDAVGLAASIAGAVIPGIGALGTMAVGTASDAIPTAPSDERMFIVAWDVHTRRKLLTVRTSRFSNIVAMNSDGRLLVVEGADRSVDAYELLRYQPASLLPGGQPPMGNVNWMYYLVNTKRPLEEKMALFWHHVFATGNSKVDNYDQLLEQINQPYFDRRLSRVQATLSRRWANTQPTEARRLATAAVDWYRSAGGYEAAVLPAGVRSRMVESVTGLNMHVLEAGFEVENRPCVVPRHSLNSQCFC